MRIFCAARDHPRSRGVYGNRVRQTRFGRGSSPLARGLPHRRRAAHLGRRIIPARAGFTASAPAAIFPTCGSSPHARGLPTTIWTASWIPGIIPARAGFTRRLLPVPPASPDHPRSRGVYMVDWRALRAARGSSPLARGLRPRSPGRICAPRIIPARAGFTGDSPRSSDTASDHPRSRGVYHPAPDHVSRAERIIPARAGFTRRPAQGSPGPRDHPRSRGVYTIPSPLVFMPVGSSPLARGLLDDEVELRGHVRIIPARAGFTPLRPPSRAGAGDHPRSRGVYPAVVRAVDEIDGSSPLARGLLYATALNVTTGGIIPARAGFTRESARYGGA